MLAEGQGDGPGATPWTLAGAMARREEGPPAKDEPGEGEPSQLDLLAWRPAARAPLKRKRKRIRRPKKITRAAYVAPTRTATQVVYHSTVVIRPAVYPDGWLDTKSPRRDVGPLDELETLEEMHATRYASWRGDRGEGIGALGGVTRGARNVCEHGTFHASGRPRQGRMVPRGCRRG